jgi:Na+-driven multidrug efflux pump
MALTFGFIGVQMVLSGALRGTGNTMVSMVLSIISLWILRFPLAYILSMHTKLAEVGLWIAFPVTNVIAAIITIVWFARGTWKQKQVTEEIKLAEQTTEETMIEEGLD